MSTVPLPPGRTFYLRVFLLSLIIVVTTLLIFLFAVTMEASIAATGIIRSKEEVQIRAVFGGLMDLGWLEGTWDESVDKPIRYRVDASGNGITNPLQSVSKRIHNWQVGTAKLSASGSVRDTVWHTLQEGDFVWPEQPLAVVLPVGWQTANGKPERGYIDENANDQTNAPALQLRGLRAPDGAELWQVINVHKAQGQKVDAGDAIVTLVPVDPETLAPRGMVAELFIEESVVAEVKPGEDVRLYSAMFSNRLYGFAQARLLRVSPNAEVFHSGKRGFRALAELTDAPFPLRLGSSVEAKIVVGQKPVYRLILEH